VTLPYSSTDLASQGPPVAPNTRLDTGDTDDLMVSMQATIQEYGQRAQQHCAILTKEEKRRQGAVTLRAAGEYSMS